MNFARILHRYFIRLYIVVHEKVWKQTVKYIFVKNKKSDKLLVVFSGFSGHYVAGRYNYIKTFFNSKINKLFILDNFGYANVGSYYLGEKCTLYDSHIITDLVTHAIEKCNAKEIIFAGSSKGGSAALLYGFIMNVTHIIAGSPQYRIADYLNQNEYHKCIMDAIKRGDGQDETWLNDCIFNAMQRCEGHTKVSLIYSSKEESYDNDVKDLIQDCQKFTKNVQLYDEAYTDHSEIGKCFSKLVPKMIQEEKHSDKC